MGKDGMEANGGVVALVKVTLVVVPLKDVWVLLYCLGFWRCKELAFRFLLSYSHFFT